MTAERSGRTKLSVTYTSPDARTARISVNRGSPTAVAFPATRSDNRPGTTRVVVTLRAGDNTVAFANPTAVAPDIDKMVITTDGTPPPPPAAPGAGHPTPPTSAGPGATTAPAGEPGRKEAQRA